MHGLAQRARAFAVNNADGKNSGVSAFGKVVFEQGRDFARTEGVQIQFAVDGEMHRVGMGRLGRGGVDRIAHGATRREARRAGKKKTRPSRGGLHTHTQQIERKFSQERVWRIVGAFAASERSSGVGAGCFAITLNEGSSARTASAGWAFARSSARLLANAFSASV